MEHYLINVNALKYYCTYINLKFLINVIWLINSENKIVKIKKKKKIFAGGEIRTCAFSEKSDHTTIPTPRRF